MHRPLIRHGLKYVPDLKPIYTAVDADAAEVEVETFDEKWGHDSR